VDDARTRPAVADTPAALLVANFDHQMELQFEGSYYAKQEVHAISKKINPVNVELSLSPVAYCMTGQLDGPLSHVFVSEVGRNLELASSTCYR
jgi:hypothetical protein